MAAASAKRICSRACADARSQPSRSADTGCTAMARLAGTTRATNEVAARDAITDSSASGLAGSTGSTARSRYLRQCICERQPDRDDRDVDSTTRLMAVFQALSNV